MYRAIDHEELSRTVLYLANKLASYNELRFFENENRANEYSRLEENYQKACSAMEQLDESNDTIIKLRLKILELEEMLENKA